MPILQAMFTLADRLKSFVGARPLLRRNSTIKGPKTVTWPHEKPSPEELANAGFYYTPIKANPDNVTCFMCQKSLDGWEADDDPTLEHLHHSRDCPWAMIICASKADELSHDEYVDPLGEAMTEARRATFADRWPHEGKKGWTCKVEKMIDAGWHYCPTPESDDFVACAYCQLALDGWEPKDKPLDEHRKRSPGCPFIELRSKPKSKRGARSSKASRVSAQSAISAATELASRADITAPVDDSGLTVATNASMASKTGKKTGRGKKATAKTTSKKGKAKQIEEVETIPEPEDSGFEVLVEQPVRAPQSRKRKTDEIESANAHLSSGMSNPQAPPPKRVATGTRGSLLKAAVLPASTPDTQSGADGSDPDPPEQLIMKVRKQRSTAGKKSQATSRRTSKRTASGASTASNALVQGAAVDVGAIDQALEADLDRPMTDEEDQQQPITLPSDSMNKVEATVAQSYASVAQPVAPVAPVRRSSRGVAARNSSTTIASQQPAKVRPESIRASLQQASPSPLPRSKVQGKTSRVRKPSAKAGTKVSKKKSEQVSVIEPVPQLIETNTRSPSAQSSDAENHPPSSRRNGDPFGPRSPQFIHIPVDNQQSSNSTVIITRSPFRPILPFEQIQSSIDENGEDSDHTTIVTRSPFKAILPFEQTDDPFVDRSPKVNHVNHDDNDDGNNSDHTTIITRSPLKAISPSKQNQGLMFGKGLQTSKPWTAVDLETVFVAESDDQENLDAMQDVLMTGGAELSSVEKKMSVEEWLRRNAAMAEDRLRQECDRMVSVFEREGNRALQTLEGMAVID